MRTGSQTLDMTPIGMIMSVVKSADETQGASLEMEWELLPKAEGTPVHIHPSAKETYKVLEGQLDVCIHGKWQRLKEGETLTVPAGVPHTFRNPVERVTRVYNTHAPAMRFEQYFEDLCAIVEKLSAGRPQKLSMNFSTATHLSMLMKKYKEEIVSVNPGGFMVTVLNSIGKLRGIKI